MSKWIVRDGVLHLEQTCIQVGSPEWFSWLPQAGRFSYDGESGKFTAQCEQRRKQVYWYAYRRSGGKLSKTYLGKTDELTFERLEEACFVLSGKALFQDATNRFDEQTPADSRLRLTPSLLPPGKVNVPAPPYILVNRPRLVRQINTPFTIISAPSGFGKTTLLHDWKQTCGFPVAWLALDETDNVPQRFWFSLAMSLQTIGAEYGKELLSYLNTSASSNLQEIIVHLTNDIARASASSQHLGLVLDDFHNINSSEVYDFLQQWLAYFPANLQLVISGHTRPPLSLAHLRAQGRLTELDAQDLRFTPAEGIHYLQQYPYDPPLAYSDLEKLVKHTEGWAAGLTLTALALGKQEDRRQFIDTFSGAHIYMREYFMETVLQRSSPRVQEFLLKTAILKHLTGSLCNVLTGHTDGDKMLTRLWEENLFIVRLEQQGWYRYHDLFAEMLVNQLQSRYPDEVNNLHQCAAQWYREQYAPADAIYHLLATEAWEEAASLMEEMALRELEQFGEDSRLLRWLQELPESVVHKHRNLLFVYLRLANVALPQKKIERFITHIEMSIANKPAVAQTPDERDVLTEIRQIRRIWAQGDIFLPPTRGNKYDAKWDLLNRLHLLKPANNESQESLDEQILDLFHAAQAQQNLFVVLMAGGVLARRAYMAGQVRRSERLARQILEQAITLRRKLPEPASITLAALCQVHLARNEIELAQKYLDQAEDVDPNPTSTNMLVEAAVLRAKIQIIQGQAKEARATLQAIRNLNLRRPSATWSDLDLLIYEALICVRGGDLLSAEQLVVEIMGSPEAHLAKLVQAEICLRNKQFLEAEKWLNEFILSYPKSIPFEPLLAARIPLALALLGQNKVSEALQTMNKAIRLAAPEHFIRPFLDSGPACAPILWLLSQNKDLVGESQAFIQELLNLLDPLKKYSQIPKTEIERLTTAALISAREQEVLTLLSAGYSNREIADQLSVSESTVKTHLENIYTKLSVNSRIQAITRARELNLIRFI